MRLYVAEATAFNLAVLATASRTAREFAAVKRYRGHITSQGKYYSPSQTATAVLRQLERRGLVLQVCPAERNVYPTWQLTELGVYSLFNYEQASCK